MNNCWYYKNCIVPQCKSTTKKTPNKLFIYVPNNKNIRKQWLKLAGRNDAHSLSIESRMYFCEDHFDLPNDMVNYMEYHIMGAVSQVRMKPGCIPSKFECQEDRKKRPCSSTHQPHILKKQRLLKAKIAECMKESEESFMLNSSLKDTSDESSSFQTDVVNVPKVLCEKTADKSVQAFITHKFRSKAVQTHIKLINQLVLPLKPSLIASSTSSVKVVTITKSSLSESDLSKIRNVLNGTEVDNDTSLNMAINSCSPSVYSLQVKSTSNCKELLKEDRNLETNDTLLNTIKKIEKKPLLYIGVPSSCYYLIDILKDELNIPKHHLLLCLNKIRLGSKFNQLADDYGMTPYHICKIFLRNIPSIASVLHPFIVALDGEMIQRTLVPVSYRYKYHNVSCIIDCLEIEVKKPSKAVNQAMMWSDKKKTYTLKYLISCTPNGMVNYISPGFGGKTTDTCLVESCDFVKTLKSNMCVMAVKGFKHLEQYLKKFNITLVRAASKTTVKMRKSKNKLSKQISSLKILKGRVIRRVREFDMVKPHSCMNLKFLRYLDNIMIIACALTNLQDNH